MPPPREVRADASGVGDPLRATRQARPPRPRGPQTERLEDLDLFQTLRRALRSEDPTAFLLTAAPIAQVVLDGLVIGGFYALFRNR